MPNPDGSMTQAEQDAYRAKHDRERPEYQQLRRRYEEAWSWLESHLNSLTHWRRVVEQFEHLMHQCREEEAALPPCEGSALLRELVHDNPVLGAAGSLHQMAGQHRTHTTMPETPR
jgi:hypothetical protein